MDPMTMMMLAQAGMSAYQGMKGGGGGGAAPAPATGGGISPAKEGGGLLAGLGGMEGIGAGLGGLGAVLGGAGLMFGGDDKPKTPPQPANPGFIKPIANPLEQELYDRMMMMALQVTPKSVPQSLTFAQGGRPQTDVINLVGEKGPELFMADTGRMNMVGEGGPEFFEPSARGTIIPNKNLPAPMQAGQGPQQIGGDREISIQPRAEGGPVGGASSGGAAERGHGQQAQMANYQPAPYQPSFPGSQYALQNTLSQQPLFTPQQTVGALQTKGPVAGEMTSRVMAQGPTYQYDPNVVNQEFQEQVFNPAMRNFSTNLAPFMREQALMSGSATGEETPRYVTRQLGSMAEGLEAQRSQMQTAGRDRQTAAFEANANRQLQALPILNDLYGDALAPLRQLSEYKALGGDVGGREYEQLAQQLQPQLMTAFPNTEYRPSGVKENAAENPLRIRKFAMGGRMGPNMNDEKVRRRMMAKPEHIGLKEPAYTNNRGGQEKTMNRIMGLQQFMQAMFGSNQPLLPSQEKVSKWESV